MTHRKEKKLIFLYLLVFFFCFLICLSYGTVQINLFDFIALEDQENREGLLDILKLRFIRIGEAGCAGALMAISGLVLQKILRNPLADPFIMGISSGGILCSVFFSASGLSSLLFGRTEAESFLAQFSSSILSSFIGCFLTILFIFYIKSKLKNISDEYLLPVIGIVLNSFFGALLTFILVLADHTKFFEIQYYFVGSIRPLSLQQLFLFAFFALFPIFFILKKSATFPILLFGDDFANANGVAAKKVKGQLILAVSLLTSIVISMAGVIGFLGIIVPHIVRILHNISMRSQLIISMLFGSSLLMIADLFSRVAFSPRDLPIGIFTAFLGTPILCFLLLRRIKP